MLLYPELRNERRIYIDEVADACRVLEDEHPSKAELWLAELQQV